ncbi:uncharacterized protein LOC113316805 [Papaver somniferum]|uniref:uncharacterized protein LOC113316805 n=1 Tax=Papaver somniferum TaxID=3469 RepID=UPI000E6F5BE7|nr:uncharacterized protein LOC113316805 [Papaver somniferum]
MGRSVDVLFYHTFRALGYEDSDLLPSAYTLYGFNGVATSRKGEICLEILAGDLEKKFTLCVIYVESPYNYLIGRPWVHGIKGVASTYHQMIRFSIPSGIGEIRGSSEEAENCNKKYVDIYESKVKRKKERKWKVLEVKKDDELRGIPGKG